jgi:hypothetical protein
MMGILLEVIIDNMAPQIQMTIYHEKQIAK